MKVWSLVTTYGDNVDRMEVYGDIHKVRAEFLKFIKECDLDPLCIREAKESGDFSMDDEVMYFRNHYDRHEPEIRVVAVEVK